MSKADLLKKSIQSKNKGYTEGFNDVKDIQIKDIKLNPFQPRKTFNEESIKELSESIKENGLIQPITITNNNILIAGERRLKACKLLNLQTIKAILIKDVNDEKMERLAIIENLQREDLSLYDEVVSIYSLLSNNSIREVGKIIGKSKSYVARRKEIFELIEKENLQSTKVNELGVKQILKQVGQKKVSHSGTDKIKVEKSININENNQNTKDKILPYNLKPNEQEAQKIYQDSGFEIFFNDTTIAIRGNKKAFDIFTILKLLKEKLQ